MQTENNEERCCFGTRRSVLVRTDVSVLVVRNVGTYLQNTRLESQRTAVFIMTNAVASKSDRRRWIWRMKLNNNFREILCRLYSVI